MTNLELKKEELFVHYVLRDIWDRYSENPLDGDTSIIDVKKVLALIRNEKWITVNGSISPEQVIEEAEEKVEVTAEAIAKCACNSYGIDFKYINIRFDRSFTGLPTIVCTNNSTILVMSGTTLLHAFMYSIEIKNYIPDNTYYTFDHFIYSMLLPYIEKAVAYYANIGMTFNTCGYQHKRAVTDAYAMYHHINADIAISALCTGISYYNEYLYNFFAGLSYEMIEGDYNPVAHIDGVNAEFNSDYANDIAEQYDVEAVSKQTGIHVISLIALDFIRELIFSKRAFDYNSNGDYIPSEEIFKDFNGINQLVELANMNITVDVLYRAYNPTLLRSGGEYSLEKFGYTVSEPYNLLNPDDASKFLLKLDKRIIIGEAPMKLKLIRQTESEYHLIVTIPDEAIAYGD